MRYLTAGDVCRIHELEVGPSGLPVDFGLLESAVLRPQQGFGSREVHVGLHQKAAALFHGLVKNHPFIDGNKRAAVGALIVFYNLNGWDLVVDDAEIIDLALRVAETDFSVDGIAEWFERRVERLVLPNE